MKTILVVDNHPLILQFMHDLLETKGNKVFTVEDGLAALNLLKTIRPDVIFTDLVMPNIRGDKLCRIIRNIPQLKTMPIYILSGLVSDGNICSAQWGVNGCIPKGPLHIMARQVLAAVDTANGSVIFPDFKENFDDCFVRRAVVRELIESYRHIDSILHHTSEGILELTTGDQVVYVNPRAAMFFDLPEDRILGKPFVELFPDANYGQVFNLLNPFGKAEADISKKIFALNGKLLTIRVFPFDNDSLRKRLVIMKDETDQIKAKEALHASKEKYQRLVEGLHQIVFDATSNGIVTYINPAVEPITGYAASEILGTRICDYVLKKDRLRIQEALNDIRTGVERDFELQVMSSRGEIRLLQVSCSPIFLHSKWVGVQGMASDITEKKWLQRHLIRSHRLAATGQLAGCIAHEINSPLQGITALINLIKKEHDHDAQTLNNIGLLEQAYDSIRNTIQKMLTLGQPHKSEKHPLYINDVIHDALRICHTQLTQKKISLDLNLSTKIPLIRACSQELRQVFLCLIQNSMEALDSDLMTKTKTEEQDTVWSAESLSPTCFIRMDVYATDQHLVIDYRDSGSGISPDELDSVFDPFYTRKKTFGLGIGLSVCFQIIEDHRGYMRILETDDQQTVFRIKLPAYHLPELMDSNTGIINDQVQ
jgi:PAS domain S-box-containing protein